MPFQTLDAAAAKAVRADVKTPAPMPDIDALTASHYRHNDPDAGPLFTGIAILIAVLAVLCIWAFMDASAFNAAQRTRLDLPAAACPAPSEGKALVVTVQPIGNSQFVTNCRIIAGRA